MKEVHTDHDGNLLSAILDSTAALILVLDREGRIVRFNRACEEATGYSFVEVSGRFLWDFFPAYEQAEPAKTAVRAIHETRSAIRFQHHWLSKNGEIRLLAWTGEPLPSPDRNADLAILLGLDFPERGPAQAASRQDQAQLASIIESAMDSIIIIDRDQNIVLFNAAAERMFQCPAASAIGKPIDQFIPARFRAAHRDHVSQFDRTSVTRRQMGQLGAIWGVRRDGAEFPIEASISQTEVDGEKFFTVIIRDITQRKRSEEQLREQAEFLDGASDAIIVRDLQDRIIYWNRGAERLYGWSAAESVGVSIQELYYQEATPQFEEANQILLKEGKWAGHARHLTKDRRHIDVETRLTLMRDGEGNPKSVLVINTDVTERKKLEAQFLRAQRMESIGTLAGGIAHDINNILSPILLAVRMLQMKFQDEDSQRLLSVLHQSAERGGVMVKQVLEFARGVEGERIVLQLNHLIKEITKTLAETFPKSIAVECFVPADVWSVTGDPTQIHQVLLNLCLNARDAMPRGGVLSVKAENVSIDESYAQMIIDARPGSFVLVSVTDTGTGIPAEILNRVFEPFFTTKEHGKGTGLGLSTVLGIVKSHGGFINVYSEIGRGSQFRLYFPAAESPLTAQARDERVDVSRGHGELVLVVDDEAAIREITRSTLETFGYSALTASDGTEAIALYAQNKDAIDVVLTDMMMPYLDGTATIRALQRINPRVKIIASTGLTDDGKSAEAAELGVKSFLSKPYTAEELMSALAEILARN
ncbi:MAG TPA: PAS domain S-box protein [Blastocatellia bacterium]|nr:PAS domain S-box protein [Blastocatellia bacterium]